MGFSHHQWVNLAHFWAKQRLNSFRIKERGHSPFIYVLFNWYNHWTFSCSYSHALNWPWWNLCIVQCPIEPFCSFLGPNNGSGHQKLDFPIQLSIVKYFIIIVRYIEEMHLSSIKFILALDAWCICEVVCCVIVSVLTVSVLSLVLVSTFNFC